MSSNPRVEYFDGIAERWDGWEDLTSLPQRFAAGLSEFGLAANETVLDVGCGTGNLTRALLVRLSLRGRVAAIDISPRMIEFAKRKIADPRVEWRVAAAEALPFADASFDRAFCYSVWPHFDDDAAAVGELRRVLRPGGRLHVWHLISRKKVNEIHAGAGEAVRRDVLPSADDVSFLLGELGFRVVDAVDGPDRYLVTAVKIA